MAEYQAWSHAAARHAAARQALLHERLDDAEARAGEAGAHVTRWERMVTLLEVGNVAQGEKKRWERGDAKTWTLFWHPQAREMLPCLPVRGKARKR